DIIATFTQIVGYTNMTGYNPADGISGGGLMINKEAYNQFRRNDSQLPNHYYTVDITADELAQLKAYLADPNNNVYSLFNMSCATSTVNIWNTTLSDRPEHQIKGNLTGLANDPMSIYCEVGTLKYKSDLDGKGGDDFYPRIVVLEPSEKPQNPDEPVPVEPDTWYMLGDADGDREITILDATTIQRYLASIITEEYIDLTAGDVTKDGIDITDATFIQRYLASMETPHPIGERFNRASA
ncbi:MAG: dockerin type I repeat-containing protein, partial [Ruminococcus sp.]|nr:dockerin type I repeat-containing protein [Ruminococcus sp.]